MRKLIRKLSDMRGISGFEYRLTDQIADMFKTVSYTHLDVYKRQPCKQS